MYRSREVGPRPLPLCDKMCLLRLSALRNCFPQLASRQMKGLSSVWVRRWVFKFPKMVNSEAFFKFPKKIYSEGVFKFPKIIYSEGVFKFPKMIYSEGAIKFPKKIYCEGVFKQGYRYHKLRKTFSKFYRRYYDLISKFQVGLKSLLRQGLSEPDFYGDLVYKLKKIVGSNNFSAQFIKIISHYKKIGYNINVLQQTACLVVNPITVGNFAFLFNCTPVGRTSDSMMVPT